MNTSLVVDRIGDKFLVGDGCWPWIGTLGSHRYGVIKIKQQQFLAHRLIYELLVGPIPAGLEIDHTCRFRPCVNPAHLEPVTAAENNRRTKGHRAPNTRPRSANGQWVAA